MHLHRRLTAYGILLGKLGARFVGADRMGEPVSGELSAAPEGRGRRKAFALYSAALFKRVGSHETDP